MHEHSKLLKWILKLTLVALTAYAGDISGKWSGVIEINDDGRKIETPVEMLLEQKGEALSGKIGRSGDVRGEDMRNAKIEGNTLTFETSSVENSAEMKFSLTVKGDQMQGEMKGTASGNDIVAKVTLARAK